MNELTFRVLGPLEAITHGRSISLGGPKQRKLLTLLLLRRGREVSIDVAIDTLWGDRPPETAVKTIHKYVSELRKALGDPNPIETRSGGYVAALGPLALDADRFEELLDRAHKTQDPSSAAAILDEASGLWRGTPWPELDDDQAATAERARLEERRLSALEELVDLDLDLGRHERALPLLEELVVTNPLRERFWARLMLALYRSGRQAEALDAFRRVHAVLVDQLGIEPSMEVAELQGRILAQDPRLLPRAPAPSRRAELRTAHLPGQLTRFVGRRRELVRVEQLLDTTRLVTLTGVGGSGKTRLALEAARSGSAAYPGGVWFVPLEALEDPRLLPEAVAASVGAREQQGSALTETIADALHNKRVLLVFDNCEHLIEACARMVDELTRRCPELSILATSREKLNVAGETVFHVPPMPVPQSEGLPVGALLQTDSIELFVDRASASLPGFELTDANKEQVARLCMRLDGIPLALELAAGRVAALDVEEIARRLDGHLDLLGEGSRVAPPRHHTLRATIDWSFGLLEDAGRELMLRLTVFAGGFSVEAAETVCADGALDQDSVLGLLLELVDKSLVVRPDPDAGPTRYRMLEPLRSYGREKLRLRGDEEQWREQHADYYIALAERARPHMRGPDQTEWFQRLGIELPNIRAALDWARRSPEIGLQMLISLRGLWDARGHPSEALKWTEEALETGSDLDARLRARASVDAAWHALSLSRAQRAEELAEAALGMFRSLEDEWGIAEATHAIGWAAHTRGAYPAASLLISESVARHRALGNQWPMAWALHHLGMVKRQQGDYEDAVKLQKESLELFRQAGDHLRVGYVLWNLGVVARYQGNYDAATRRCEEALALFIDVGDVSGAAHVRYTLGDIARLTGEHQRATLLYRESLEDLREMGDLGCVASTLGNLGANAQAGSDLVGASSFFLESLELRRRFGDEAGVAECLEGLAEIHAARGEEHQAVELLGAASGLRHATGAVRPAAEQREHLRKKEALRGVLGVEEFLEAWTRGSGRPDAIVGRVLKEAIPA